MKRNSSPKDRIGLNVVERTPYSGWLRFSQMPIGRTLATRLAKEGQIQSVLVKSPGSRRGVRLFSAASLDAYLTSLIEKEAAK